VFSADSDMNVQIVSRRKTDTRDVNLCNTIVEMHYSKQEIFIVRQI
jgi:hypothetical protein